MRGRTRHAQRAEPHPVCRGCTTARGIVASCALPHPCVQRGRYGWVHGAAILAKVSTPFFPLVCAYTPEQRTTHMHACWTGTRFAASRVGGDETVSAVLSALRCAYTPPRQAECAVRAEILDWGRGQHLAPAFTYLSSARHIERMDGTSRRVLYGERCPPRADCIVARPGTRHGQRCIICAVLCSHTSEEGYAR